MSRLFSLALAVATIFHSIVATTHVFPQHKESWQERLSVSMNGVLPEDLPEGFALKYWHSLRLNLSSPRITPNFELGIIARRKLFYSKTGELLKNAIIDADVRRIGQLLNDGADVNEKGEGGITPLYLALLKDTDPRPFEILIANGANPNIPNWTHLNAVIGSGSTVCDLAAIPSYNRLFQLTIEAGGNPNGEPSSRVLWAPPFSRTLRQPDAIERLKLLAENGADFNREYSRICGNYLADCLFTGFWEKNDDMRDRLYGLAMIAIEHGADCEAWSRPSRSYEGKESEFINGNFQPIHYLALAAIEGKETFETGSIQRELLEILEKNGQSLEQAKNDLVKRKARKDQEKRLAEATEEEFTKWLAEGIPNHKEKELRDRWDDPQWRIQRLPVSTYPSPSHSVHDVSRWQRGFWSDIVKSEMIHKYLVEKWAEVKVFDDPQVESLKLAMFARDIPEMKRLIEEENVDVNALGRDNLTLLYLSLGIDDDPRPFELLLESGANPNIPNKAEHEQKWLAVVHVIAKSMYCRHFKTVFEHGGDANLVASGRNPIGFIPFDCFDWGGRVEFLCEQGADINQASSVPIVKLLAADWLNSKAPGRKPKSRKRQMLVAIKLGAELDFQMESALWSPRYPEKGVERKIGRCILELPHILLECYAPFGVDVELKGLVEAQGFSFERAEAELEEWRKLIAEGKLIPNTRSK